jgi:hypothetical protein
MNCFSWENVERVEAAWVRHEGRQVRIQARCIQQLQPDASCWPVHYIRARRSFFTQGQWPLQTTAVKHRLEAMIVIVAGIVKTTPWLVHGLDDREIVVRFLAGVGDFFFFVKNEFWVPHSLLYNWQRGLPPRDYSGRGEKLSTKFHTLPTFRMNGAVCLSRKPSHCTVGHLYL